MDNFRGNPITAGDENRPIVFAQIDKEINSFALEYNGFLLESTKATSTPLLFFNKKDVDEMIKDKLLSWKGSTISTLSPELAQLFP